VTRPRVLPGYRLALAYATAYLALLVLVPLAACFLRAARLTRAQLIAAVWSDRAVAAYALTFGASLAAALVNAVFGLILAWALVRYDFPGKRLLDSLVDVPLALPTAVAGLTFSSLYVETGWLGCVLVPLGVRGAYSRLAVVLVLAFTGLPFVVRAVQPVLETADPATEEAAACLGATRGQTFRRVTLPYLLPAWITGFALAFARALGEYGSVVFVSGNLPYRTEIAPVLIVARLEEFAYGEATAIASVLLLASFGALLAINGLERWSVRRYA